MIHVTGRLTGKNRDQLWNPTLGNRVWATSTFYYFMNWLKFGKISIIRSYYWHIFYRAMLRFWPAISLTFPGILAFSLTNLTYQFSLTPRNPAESTQRYCHRIATAGLYTQHKLTHWFCSWTQCRPLKSRNHSTYELSVEVHLLQLHFCRLQTAMSYTSSHQFCKTYT